MMLFLVKAKVSTDGGLARERHSSASITNEFERLLLMGALWNRRATESIVENQSMNADCQNRVQTNSCK